MLSYPLLSGGERLGSSDRHERSRGGSVRPCQGPIALALPTSRQGQSEQAERDHPQSRRLAAGPRLRQDLRGAAVQPLQPGGRAHAACCTSRPIGSATARFTRAFRGLTLLPRLLAALRSRGEPPSCTGSIRKLRCGGAPRPMACVTPVPCVQPPSQACVISPAVLAASHRAQADPAAARPRDARALHVQPLPGAPTIEIGRDR